MTRAPAPPSVCIFAPDAESQPARNVPQGAHESGNKALGGGQPDRPRTRSAAPSAGDAEAASAMRTGRETVPRPRRGSRIVAATRAAAPAAGDQRPRAASRRRVAVPRRYQRKPQTCVQAAAPLIGVERLAICALALRRGGALGPPCVRKRQSPGGRPNRHLNPVDARVRPIGTRVLLANAGCRAIEGKALRRPPLLLPAA